VGTSHPIQRGNQRKTDFKAYIESLVSTYSPLAIAEEINDNQVTIAQSIANTIKIPHEIIEPTPQERSDLGIETRSAIMHDILFDYDEIDDWPDEPSPDNLPVNAYNEYFTRIQKAYREREQEWLVRLRKLNTWPVIVICGSSHHQPFTDLLSTDGFKVVDACENWE